MLQTPSTSPRLKADLILLLVAILWGSAFISQGIAALHRLAFLFNGVCFLLGALLLVPFIPCGTRLPPHQWRWMLLAGFILFGATAFQQVGLFFTQVANAGFLTSLYVIFTPFLLWVMFRQPPRKLDIFAVFAASIGAFFLSTGGRYQAQFGDILEVIGAMFWGMHLVVVSRAVTRFHPVTFAAGHFFITGMANLMTGFFFEDPARLASLPMLGAVLYRAVVSIGLGYTLQVWAQKHTPPTHTALILSLEAVFAALAGWLLLRQALLPIQILGCGIIFIAVLISQLKRNRHVLPTG